MRLKDLLEGVRPLSCTAELTREITGVSCDSQKIQPGDVFVAVPGTQADGRRYISRAMARGACCVVCREVPQEDVPYVLVRSVRRTLAQMAKNYFGDPASGMTLVGVTGTNGKTTTTYLIKQILETALHTKVGLMGTIQNMVGQRTEEAARTTPDA
ncbi:MAG: UDP-N-acetylmuramoyl-L-alanyl-D-glutamate--2,6-diaminopimelate ligase, partial [Oscillospiraceae bacterium]|nr:UDP-N-acetylmuramoyl-L-alanyl-D-glutamate--2,6-diaminopimelate ligase [Oscillospiraceae bacterium]